MAAQPRLSAADVQHLLEPIRLATAQLGCMSADLKAALKRNAAFMNEVQTFLEQYSLAPEQHPHNNDKAPPKPLDHDLPHHKDTEAPKYQGLPYPGKGFIPPLQHHFDGLDPVESVLNGRPYLIPRSYGAPSKKPIFNGRGDPVNLDALLCCAAAARLNRPNHSASPHNAANTESILDQDRHSHAHRHTFGDNQLSCRSCESGLHESDGANSRDMDSGLRNPHSSYSPRTSHDTGHHDTQSLRSGPACGLKTSLDNEYGEDLAMGPRAFHRNLGRGKVCGSKHQCTTEFPCPQALQHIDMLRALNQAQARPLHPRPTEHCSHLKVRSSSEGIEDKSTGVLRYPTVAQISHALSLVHEHDTSNTEERSLEQLRARTMQQQAQDDAKLAYLRSYREMLSIPMPYRPALKPFNGPDKGDSPRDDCDMPLRRHVSPKHEYPPRDKSILEVDMAPEAPPHCPMSPLQLAELHYESTRTRIPFAVSTNTAKAATEETSNGQHAQGPDSNAKKGDTVLNSPIKEALTNSSKNAEDTASTSKPSSPHSNTRTQCSESAYDTPDDDEVVVVDGDDQDEGMETDSK